MAKQNEQVQNQQDQQPSELPTTPVQPVELTDEQLEHVVGGGIIVEYDVITEK